MSKTKVKIFPCKTCGRVPCVSYYEEGGGMYQEYQVICKCGHEGPGKATETQAILAWNNLNRGKHTDTDYLANYIDNLEEKIEQLKNEVKGESGGIIDAMEEHIEQLKDDYDELKNLLVQVLACKPPSVFIGQTPKEKGVYWIIRKTEPFGGYRISECVNSSMGLCAKIITEQGFDILPQERFGDYFWAGPIPKPKPIAEYLFINAK